MPRARRFLGVTLALLSAACAERSLDAHTESQPPAPSPLVADRGGVEHGGPIPVASPSAVALPTNPPAARDGEWSDGVPLVVTTEEAIFLDGAKVCDLPSLADQARRGTGECKRERAPSDLYMPALVSAAPPVERSGSRPGRVRFSFAPRTPYRTMIELLFTVGQIGFGFYELSVPAGRGLLLTGRTRPPEPWQGPTNLEACTISILDDSIVVTVSKKPAGSACRTLGYSTIQRVAGHHDFAQLARCLRQVKASGPNLAPEALLRAVAATPADTIVRTMSVAYCASDTCLSPHGDHSESFFDNVFFAVPR